MVPTYAEDGTHDWKVHKKLHQVAPTALSVCEERIKEHVAWQREQFSRRSFGLRCAVAVRTLILEGTNSWRRDGERHVPSSTLTSGQGRGQTPYVLWRLAGNSRSLQSQVSLSKYFTHDNNRNYMYVSSPKNSIRGRRAERTKVLPEALSALGRRGGCRGRARRPSPLTDLLVSS